MSHTHTAKDTATHQGSHDCCHGHHHEDHDCCHGHHHEDHDCCHGHHHEHGGTIRGRIAIIIAGTLLTAVAIALEHFLSLPLCLLLIAYLVPYLVVGHSTLHEAAEGIMHGDVFNEHFLMSVATFGAMAIGFLPGAETEFAEAVFVMLFFQVGELFEHYAEDGSRRSIAHLVELRPDVAYTERGSVVEEVSPEAVAVGETIIVRPGERVPIDGIVVEGASSLSTVAITGESVPRAIGVGDEALSGCVNLSGLLRLRTTKSFGESTVSRIISLVEEAAEHKSRSEAFVTRFARVYTPVVVLGAALLALLPPLLCAAGLTWAGAEGMPASGFAAFASAFPVWLHRALIFLVVSCPCALVISVPLTFFGGIGGASKRGILIKGANYIDALATTSTVVFDKTGTLTRGTFAVTAVHPKRHSEEELLHLAAHVEHYSTHPIASALRDAFPAEATDGCSVSEVSERAGLGIEAVVSENRVCVGNSRLMDALGIAWHDCGESGTIVHVAINGEYSGHIVINDQVKDDSREAIARLHRLGITRCVMLTGDRSETGTDVARQLCLDEWHCDLLPTGKVEVLERLLSERRGAHRSEDSRRKSVSHCGEASRKRPVSCRSEASGVAFVGDGINDAPVLARADVGIAMGGLGSDAAIEAADVVIMDDRPSSVATAIALSRRTVGIARQNVVFAIGIKAATLLLAAAGIATMWMAVFADVGVTVIAVLNAMRTLNTKD